MHNNNNTQSLHDQKKYTHFLFLHVIYMSHKITIMFQTPNKNRWKYMYLLIVIMYMSWD